MGKIWETKKEILKLLTTRAKTLTDISRALGLRPSTVSQHLKELKTVGAIEQVDNPYVKKWKYYKVASVSQPVPSEGIAMRVRMPVLAYRAAEYG
jgi:DNA-binding transcriptional ArsR family regulator